MIWQSNLLEVEGQWRWRGGEPLMLVGTRTGKSSNRTRDRNCHAFAIMSVPQLDLGEQYRVLAEPIREAIDAVLTATVSFLGRE